MTPDTNVPEGAEKTLTYGENAVGLTFNPSGSPEVLAIKTSCAAMIDSLNQIFITEPTYGAIVDNTMRVYSEKAQLIVEAIRQIQTAQMWAVKAITYKA